MDRRLVLALALSLCASLALVPGGAGAKKKRAKVGGTIDITTQVNAAVPDAVTGQFGVLRSTATVAGKRYRRTRVRDVNVVVQTTGSAALAAGHLTALLTSPDGTTVTLFPTGMGGQSIGPLALDDETPVRLQTGSSTIPIDDASLTTPYQGTAQPNCALANQGCALSAIDNSTPLGAWTLTVYDLSPAGGLTSTLNSWRLVVVAGRAYRTK